MRPAKKLISRSFVFPDADLDGMNRRARELFEFLF
jgi:hypothetical protein